MGLGDAREFGCWIRIEISGMSMARSLTPGREEVLVLSDIERLAELILEKTSVIT